MDEEIRYSKAALSRDRREFWSTQRKKEWRKFGGGERTCRQHLMRFRCHSCRCWDTFGRLFFARSQGQISPIALITTFFSFLLFFRLRNEDSCGTKSTVETKSLATGLENGKNRTEMSSSFWVRVRSRTNLFLVLLSGVSSERGKQASLVGLNFGVQPFSHFALAIFLPREIAVLFSFVGDFRELEQF